jgi:thiosulfate reductase cytochrome b subunit
VTELVHPGLAIPVSHGSVLRRHSAIVRITHWITTVSVLALVVSGLAILVTHPRLYWGETGAIGMPSLVDLPLPFVFRRQSGWGRSLHFLSAWVFVLTGLLYVLSGLVTRHVQKQLVPTKRDLTWGVLSDVLSEHVRFKRPTENESFTYNVLQRLTYLAVIFGLCPLLVATGLAMSPGITAVFSGLVTVFGGHQSARTIHFVVSATLVLFVVVHIAMVWLGGFANRVRAMVTGQVAARTERG